MTEQVPLHEKMQHLYPTDRGTYIALREHRWSECSFLGTFNSLSEAQQAVTDEYVSGDEHEWKAVENPFGGYMRMWLSEDPSCSSTWYIIQADHEAEHHSARMKRASTPE